MKNILTVVLFVLSLQNSWANEKTLTEFVSEEISSLDEAFAQLNTSEPIDTADDTYMLRRFWLRLRPKAGLKVPGFATFEVIPEIEMLWEKELPDGWETYRP